MGCLLVLLALLSPRLVIAVLWLVTDRLTVVFSSGLVGVLGFVFLPWTEMLYVLAYQPGVGVSGIGWLPVAVGVVVDLSSYAGGGGHLSNRR